MARKFAWLTPDTIPTAQLTRRIVIPFDEFILEAVNGALNELGKTENWEKFGAIEPADIAYEMQQRFWQYVNSGGANLIGAILPYATATPPENTLACDGASYARAAYPVLYDVLDPAFIVDADNFTVPDLRGRVAIGNNGAFSIGSTGGEIEHTLTVNEIPSHAHSYVPPTLNVDLETPGAPDVFAAGVGAPTNTGNAGGGQAHNNMQPYIALRYCIVAR